MKLNLKKSKANQQLSRSCRESNSLCCYKGLIFLLDEEYEKILKHIRNNPIEDTNEFIRRCKKHEGFYMYDQEQKCQFLDTRGTGSCRLHSEGVKPSECFWWPLHVYVDATDKLELRVGNCCSGCLLVNEEHIQKVADDVKKINPELIKRFRKVHSCGNDYKTLTKITH